ncbi:hypothetical protein PF010_g32385 [Phytophthora fragariae]|nr:hypothetical protein PF010_g32385 [Phytophthora fragariae]
MGPAGLLFVYNNGVPVPTPAHSQYGAVVPPTPTTLMTTMTPPTTRIRTAIPSYQNYTIGTPAVAAGWVEATPSSNPTGGLKRSTRTVRGQLLTPGRLNLWRGPPP